MKAVDDVQAKLSELPRAFATAWNAHDADMAAGIFAEDGDFIDFAGHFLHGRANFRNAHRAIFASVMSQSKMELADISARRIGPSAAVVYTMWTITGEISPKGTVLAERSGRLTMVAHSAEAGRWMVVLVQNTEITRPDFMP